MIPIAGWESWKLAHAYNGIGSGTTPTAANAGYYDSELGTPWITTSELRETYIEKTSTNVTDSAMDDFSALRVYAPNSVFMAMYGATIGRLGMSTVSATCNQACLKWTRILGPVD
jgi:type I restriction enzyme, S subunit